MRAALPYFLTSDAEWYGNSLRMNEYGAFFRVPNDTPETTDDDLSRIDQIVRNENGTYTIVTRSYGTYTIKL